MRLLKTIMVIAVTFVTSICTPSYAQSPYAIFGDNSRILEAKKLPVPNIYHIEIRDNDGASYYAEFDFRQGTVSVYDQNGNVVRQDTISYNDKARFTTVDPEAEKYLHLSPYNYCGNDPVNCIDPDGKSTWVINHAEGQFKVVGGNINDRDRNIYVGTFNKDGHFVPTYSIGITTSITSFYNSDTKSWSIGSLINMNDKSGDSFLTRIISSNPPMIDDYMMNARNNQPYDFKVTNGTGHPIKGIDSYRGMPIGVDGNNKQIITSARDIGNIAAGYIAGVNGMTWEASRLAFDCYQGGIEGYSTRNAEWYGWRMGYNNTSVLQKLSNLSHSLQSAISSLWNYLTK